MNLGRGYQKNCRRNSCDQEVNIHSSHRKLEHSLDCALDPVYLDYDFFKMADEAGMSTHKDKLVDFPPVNLLDTLISSFPKEWRGIFAALNSEHLPVQAAKFWFQKKLSNDRLCDIPPNWTDFINHLASDYPVVLNDKLFLRPKILLLPLNIQRNTLAFILHQSSFLPSESLQKLVDSCSKHSTELKGWRATYVNILQSKVNDLKRSKSEAIECRGQSNCEKTNFLCCSGITEESKSRFEELIKKNQMSKSSRTIPWLSQGRDNEMRKGDGDMSEKHRAIYRDDEGVDQDDIDMVDLTTMCATEDVDLQTKTTPQKAHPETSHDIDDSDIEIIDVTESPKHNTNVNMKTPELTVPLPPEHLIIDAEDVTEQLITGQGAAADTKHSDALHLKISALKSFLTSLEAKEDNNYFSNELDIFLTCSSLEVEYICNQLHLKGIQESSAISLCTKFIDLQTDPSFGNAYIFATHCLLPKVQELKQAPSRALFMAANLFAKKHSRAFCDGVIVKLVQGSDLHTPQVDLVNKIVKDCLSEDTRSYLLEVIFAIKTDSQGCPFAWSENTVSVVQTMVDLKPEFSSNLFATFSGVLEQQSRYLSKSLKFAKMLLAVIRTCGQLVSVHYNTFLHILEGNDTFLKKAGFSALHKVSKQ